MKSLELSILLAGVSVGAISVFGQQTNTAPASAPETNTNATAAVQPASTPTSTNVTAGTVETATAAVTTEDKAAAAQSTVNAGTLIKVNRPASPDGRNLFLNFRGAPMETVLNYLSEAAGFTIVIEAEVRGKVDAWSNQPMNKDEAVDFLNSVLAKNGYAAIRSDRTLTIVTREEAKKRDLPVKSGSNPDEIPKNEEMVTQILQVRYANAVQLTKDLLPLLPTFANMTANESANSLVITDTQADIKRMAQIIKALDTSISGIASIKVFPLRFADAKDLASILKELFPTQSSSGNRGGGGNNNPMAAFMGRFGGGQGGPGGGGMGGMGGMGAAMGGSQGTGQSEAKAAASRVAAVADERSNSLVVSAPEEIMPTIEKLVNEIDNSVENITEMRVFKLKFADPVEMADLLSNVFPDETRSDSSRSSFQFRGGMGAMGGMFGGNRGGSSTSTSTRAQKKGKVVAVADQRTASVVVSAASEMMPDIAKMITELDSDPRRKQKVFVYQLDNADVTDVQQVLQDMFQSQNSRNNSRNSTTTNPLQQRQQNQGYGSSSSSAFSSSSRSSSSRTSN